MGHRGQERPALINRVGLKAAGRPQDAAGHRRTAAVRRRTTAGHRKTPQNGRRTPQDSAIYSEPSHSRLLIGSTLAFEWCHFDDLELYLKVTLPSQVQYLRNYIGYDHRN